SKVGLQSGRTSRPPRKRRRKEIDLRDSGFHNTFVMRMFDRSVDLAQFELSSPLYPICRAWMINQPHNSSLNVKQEVSSPSNDMFNSANNSQEDDYVSEILPDGPPQNITKLPQPEHWPEDVRICDPRIPEPLPNNEPKLDINNPEIPQMEVLIRNYLKRWRQIRNH
ncbi:lin37, partial [Halocaridina rubra]